jgi:hypothetical protein
LSEPNQGIVPTDAAGAQFPGYEARSERLSSGTEGTPIGAIADEHYGHDDDIDRERKPRISDKEHGERREQNITAADPIRQKAHGIGD